jgi:FkbM family methyltransferase
MLKNIFFKNWRIKICRYIFGQKFLPVTAGPLKGYLWSTSASYDYILGEYEDPAIMRVFLSWLKSSSVYYDIGSSMGFHALTANTVITTGEIYAFEPVPGTMNIFKKHISLNSKLINGNRIKLLPFAISDKEKQVDFSDNTEQRDGNTYIKESPVFSGTENKITVLCKSIDGLLVEGYRQPDIIKIDVEGAEYDVLRGAKSTLELYKPHILLATHDCHLPGVQEKCVDFLQQLGYRLQHTGNYHKYIDGLDDYIAIHKTKL